MSKCVWVYDHGIDVDGLRRFHHQLGRGLLSRGIERSPLLFGRDRWVSADMQSDLVIAVTPRPGHEFDAWLDERANVAVHAEHGPGWHLAVLPFTDGGAGLSLVASHYLIDGVGLCQALAKAASGNQTSITWPAASSRRRWQALGADARQTVRDIHGIGRAAIAAARFARRHRSGAATAPSAPISDDDEKAALSTTTIYVDADVWDARADMLGGTANTLLAGMAARLAHRVGRRV